MNQISVTEWLAMSPAEKSARAEAIVASVEWKENSLYAIGDPINHEGGIGDFPLYVCTLDEEGYPWLGEVQSVVSPDPEDWYSAETVVTSISQIYPQ